MKILKRIFLIFFIVFVGIQFIPTQRNVSSEVYEADFIKLYKVPLGISEKLTISCYDCHSNNTKYPWYNKIQPVSWYLENHIYEGKDELNFNEFGNYSVRRQKSKLKSIIREIEGDKMPLSSYVNMHNNAKIDEDEKKVLLVFFEKLIDTLEFKNNEGFKI